MTHLSEIRARLEAATPGPWTCNPCGQSVYRYEISPGPIAGILSTWGEIEDEIFANARLIGHAPADIAYLLARVERIQKIESLASGVASRILDALGSCSNFDHHGNCQSHFVERPCSVEALRILLGTIENPKP